MLRLYSFSINEDDETYPVKLLRGPPYPVDHEGTFIDANKESRFKVQVLHIEPDFCNRVERTGVITKTERELMTAVRQAAKRLACEFSGSQTSFYRDNKEITTRVDCSLVAWVQGCLFKIARDEKGGRER
jgi:hypothetical protein